MAEFNEPNKYRGDAQPVYDPLAVAPAPSGLGYSRGTDRAQVNKAWGELFGGLGNLITGGLSVIDTKNQLEVDRLAREGVTKINETSGSQYVREAAEAGQPPTKVAGEAGPFQEPVIQGGVGKPGKGTPAEISRLGATSADLQELYRQGKLSKTYVDGRIDALAKTLYRQYPGYEREIDAAIGRADPTGSASRKSVRDDLDAQARAAAGINSQIHTILKDASDTGVSQITIQRYLKGEIPIESVQTERYLIASDKANIDYAKKRAESARESQAPTFALDLQQRKTAGLGPVLEATYEKVKRFAATNYEPTPEEGKELVNLATQLEVGFEQMASGMKTEYAAKYNLKPTEMETYVESERKEIAALANAIKTKQWGIVGGFAERMALTKDATTRDIMKRFPELPRIEAVSNMVGQQVFSAAMVSAQGAQLLGNVAKQAAQAILVDGATPPGGKPPGSAETLTDSVTRLEDLARTHPTKITPKDVAGATATGLQMMLYTAANSKSEEGARNIYQHMFKPGNENFIRKFVGSDQLSKVYTQMVHPSTTAKVDSLRDGVLSLNYRKWALEDSFIPVYGRTLYELKDYAGSAAATKITFNPTSGFFTLEGKAGALPNSAYMRKGQELVTNLNAAVAAVTPLLKEQGKTPAQYIFEQMTKMGFDPEADTAVKYGTTVKGYIQEFGKFVYDKLTPEELGVMPDKEGKYFRKSLTKPGSLEIWRP